MGIEEWWSLYFFACWHVLMPGHGKTLLAAAAVAGGFKNALIPLAAGYSIAHGAFMALAAIAGLLMADRLGDFLVSHGLWIRNIYLPILLAFGLYFTFKTIKSIKQSRCDNDQRLSASGSHCGSFCVNNLSLVKQQPFLTGLTIGLIPCSDVIGLAAISPALFQAHQNIYAAGLAVWLGVTTTIMGLAVGLWILPVKSASRFFPDWLPYAAAALICYSVLLYRGVRLWQDYSLLF